MFGYFRFQFYIMAIFGFLVLAGNGLIASEPGKKKTPALPQREMVSITHHSLTLDGLQLQYRADTGYMPLKNESGTPMASVFFISYTKKTTAGSPHRPITFAFNGGPGSSSVWIHMGGLGPKRALLSDDGMPYPPPYTYVENNNTWLDFTDLVFIDPVSTGYSRPAPGADCKHFHGIKEDIRWVAEFIRLYVTRFQRWDSPKFICGASYGVERAVRLAKYLQDRHMMYFRGLVLLVGGLNWDLPQFKLGNDLSYALYLPTYTAAAWFHKKLPENYLEDLDSTLTEVEQWTLSHYLPALAKGDTLSSTEKNSITQQLSIYTGLSRDFIRAKNLRIHLLSFQDRLLQHNRQSFGIYDCRYVRDTGFLPDNTKGISLGDLFYDPALASINGTLTAALNLYLREELKYLNDLPYETFAFHVYPWNQGAPDEGLLSVMEPLNRAMTKNKHLNVLLANGYFDVLVPYYAIPYAVSHLGLPQSLRKNISIKCYLSGHFMYGHPEAAKELKKDVSDFYASLAAKKNKPEEN